MTTNADVLDLVGEIYDYAIAPGKWTEVLERMARHIGGSSAAISLQDPLKREVRLLAKWGVDPGFEQAMQDNLHLNPVLPMGWFVDLDEPFSGEGALGREDYLNSRFYKEVISPFGIYDAALAVIAKAGNRFGSLSIQVVRRSRMPRSIGSVCSPRMFVVPSPSQICSMPAPCSRICCPRRSIFSPSGSSWSTGMRGSFTPMPPATGCWTSATRCAATATSCPAAMPGSQTI
jgi:hypothetical protein